LIIGEKEWEKWWGMWDGLRRRRNSRFVFIFILCESSQLSRFVFIFIGMNRGTTDRERVGIGENMKFNPKLFGKNNNLAQHKNKYLQTGPILK